MVLKLHGSPYSTCTQRVTTIFLEKNVEYELVPIDFSKGEHKMPAFLALQPFGKVPVLEDDGVFIYESRAICKYIAAKYAGQGTKLLPHQDDFQAYALFEQACSVEAFYFDGPASGIAFEKVFKGMKGLGAADESRVAAHSAAIESALGVYETILSKQAYLAGNELTLADLFHLPYGNLIKGVGYADSFDKHPHVKAWFDGLSARESWKKVTS